MAIFNSYVSLPEGSSPLKATKITTELLISLGRDTSWHIVIRDVGEAIGSRISRRSLMPGEPVGHGADPGRCNRWSCNRKSHAKSYHGNVMECYIRNDIRNISQCMYTYLHYIDVYIYIYVIMCVCACVCVFVCLCLCANAFYGIHLAPFIVDSAFQDIFSLNCRHLQAEWKFCSPAHCLKHHYLHTGAMQE